MLAQVLGGIGLFLIGMVLTTDGLRAASGDALRRILLRFTGGPFKALLAGAAVTAVVQSSSATTVATIGFVGAGLITFHQSLGIIFGANIGTTATGWIVAALGLKFSMSTVALPLVGLGAMVRLFGHGRAQHLGLAIAGFGMIFVGIDVLQAGMGTLSDRLTPESLPDDTLLGRVALVGLGILLTAVMQSSSAAMATTLTAAHSGSLSLEQAAAIVIGVNVGTTVTAGIAAIGASLAAKRTALAHLLFNAITGCVAFATLPLLTWIVARLGERLGADDVAVTVAAFHTAFNLIGVALLLPLSRRFAQLVEHLIQPRGPRMLRYLDPRAAHMGAIAVEAVRSTALEIGAVLFLALREMLRVGRPTRPAIERLEAAASALTETQRYMSGLRVMETLSDAEHQRHESTVHALDYLARLIENTQEISTKAIRTTPALRDPVARIDACLGWLLEWAADPQRAAPVERARQVTEEIAAHRKRQRTEVLARTARGHMDPIETEKQLDAMRWIDEIGFYLYRICDRLGGERIQQPAPSPPSAPLQ